MLEQAIEKQNVTLSLPKNLISKAKKVAIDYQTSLSGLMTKLLTDLVTQRDEYQLAKQRHLSILNQGFDLGTKGQIDWSRESLYER